MSDRFGSGESSLGHAWRVGAWSGALASARGVSREGLATLERLAVSQIASLDPDTPCEVRDVQGYLLGEAPTSPQVEQLGDIAQLARDLDDACEYDAEFGEEGADLPDLESEASEHLGLLDRTQVERLGEDVPVFQDVAIEAVQFIRNGVESLRDLSRLVGRDPSLAGQVVAAANTVSAGGLERVDTIDLALARLGTDKTLKLIIAAVVKLVWGPSVSKHLWRHSLIMAAMMSRSAVVGGIANSGVGFLIGLVHDVGKIVMSRVDASARERILQLTSKGCPSLTVERVVARIGHDELGAQVLRRWGFDDALIEAVRYHHQPQRSASRLAALLYLGESACEGDGEFRSSWRAERAEAVSGLRASSIVMPDGGELEGYLGGLL